MTQTKYYYRGFTILMVYRFNEYMYEIVGGTKYYKNLEEAKKSC